MNVIFIMFVLYKVCALTIAFWTLYREQLSFYNNLQMQMTAWLGFREVRGEGRQTGLDLVTWIFILFCPIFDLRILALMSHQRDQ